MKFKVGDQVLVTAGKDKGKKSSITRILPKSNRVLVKDVNIYVKHVKPFMDKPGERKQEERPLPLSKIAIVNDKGQADRIAYKVSATGQKERIFAKTGQLITSTAVKIAKEDKKAAKAQKTEKKTRKK